MADRPSESRSSRRPPSDLPPRVPPDHAGMLFAAATMFALGWGGLYWLVNTQPVGLGPQIWGFFALLHMAVTGTVLPVVRFFNVRLTPLDSDPPPAGVIVRQSVWFGLFAVICAWLQIPRVLSLPIVFFLALVFIVLEIFLRTRELNAEDEQ